MNSYNEMTALFLICAMSLPSLNHTRPAITPWSMAKNEEDQLKDFIRKNEPEAEVKITPRGNSKKWKEYGWEKIPWIWKDNEIWIKRHPRAVRASA